MKLDHRWHLVCKLSPLFSCVKLMPGADPGFCNWGGGGGGGGRGGGWLWCTVGPLHPQKILNFGFSWGGGGLSPQSPLDPPLYAPLLGSHLKKREATDLIGLVSVSGGGGVLIGLHCAKVQGHAELEIEKPRVKTLG